MINLVQNITAYAADSIRSFVRFHSLPQWPAKDYWWFGLTHAWVGPLLPFRRECRRRLTVESLNGALAELDVAPDAISRRGAHTFLELDHIAFVYRVKQYKDGSRVFLIAPHLKGERFRDCAHSFIEVWCTELDLAQALIEIDRAVPALRTECEKAYYEAIQEKRIREIKLETARAFISDYFDGDVPEKIVSLQIADSIPGAVDLIRVVAQDKGGTEPQIRMLDIPYDLRERLQKGYLETFLADPSLDFGTVAVRGDGESAAVSLRSYGA